MLKLSRIFASQTGPGTAAPRPKTLWDKLAYGFGSVAFGVKDNGFGVLLMLYYNQVLGLPAATVGLALMLVLVLDALIDPVVGYVSDHWRSKWGRRHPFMYAAAVPVALSYLALWAPPAGLSEAALLAYLVLVATLVRTFITFYEIPSSALVTDLTPDYDQRTSFLGYRFFFGWWGGLSMSILAFSVFLRPTSQYPVGQLNPAGYLHYGVAAAAIMLGAILISAAGTHRHIPSFKPAPAKRNLKLREALSEARESLSNRAFLSMLGAGFAAAIATGLTMSMLVYMRTYLWELTGDQVSLLILGNFGSTIVALALTPRLAKAFGKKNAAIAALVATMVNAPLIYLLRLAGLAPENGTPALLALLFISSFLATIFTILAGVYTASMIADAVEHNEVRTGRRADGLFFSANGFILKSLSGVGVFAAGMLLDFVHFPQNAQPGQVSETILTKMMLTEAPIVIVLQLIAIAFICGYPITRRDHEENLFQLDAQEKAAAELERPKVL